MTEAQIGDSSALVFAPESLHGNDTLPACIFGAFVNVSTLSFSSIGLVGTLPQFEVSPASTLMHLSVSNNSLHGTISSSFQQLDLAWLDISNNQLTSGLVNLENSNAITYLDISSNNFTNSAINTSLGNWIPINFPNLRYYDLRGNKFNLSEMQSIALTSLSSNSVMAAMRINIDGDLVCGDCSLGVQLSGECHTQPCANATALEEVNRNLLQYIEENITPGGNLTILHTMRFCAETTLFLIQYTNTKAAARSVVNTIGNLPNDSYSADFVLNSRSRTRCPPGRVGATCNYFCEVGWQRQAPTDGKGGYVHSPDSGGQSPADVYPSFKCLLPLNCGGNCTLGMNVVMYTCSDYLESLADEDKEACQISMTSAAYLCAESDYNSCLGVVESKFQQIMDQSYANNMTVGPGQSSVAVNVQASSVVTGPPTAAEIQFQINLLLNLMRARAAGGAVYATLLSSSTTPASRKRDTSTNMILTLNLQFNVVADTAQLAAVADSVQSYVNNGLATDAGIAVQIIVPPTPTPAPSASTSTITTVVTTSTSTSTSTSATSTSHAATTAKTSTGASSSTSGVTPTTTTSASTSTDTTATSSSTGGVSTSTGATTTTTTADASTTKPKHSHATTGTLLGYSSVTISVGLQGTCSGFDPNKMVTIAEQIGATANVTSCVDSTKRSSSFTLEVVFTTVDQSQPITSNITMVLQAQLTNMGEVIVDSPSVIYAYYMYGSVAPPPGASKSNHHHQVAVGVGVGIGLGLPIIVLIVLGVFYRRQVGAFYNTHLSEFFRTKAATVVAFGARARGLIRRA